MSDGSSPPGRKEWSYPYWFRVVEVILGLASVVISLAVIVSPGYGAQNLVPLLSLALVFSAVRMIAAGSARESLKSLEGLGVAGAGVTALILVVAVVLVPGLSLQTLVLLLAISLTIQGLGRMLSSAGRGRPQWLRGSSLATGVAMVALAAIVEFVRGVALLTLVELLALTVLTSGADAIVSGLGPNQKQLTLLKLVVFAAFYGIIFVNWIDLFNGGVGIFLVPGYHIWVIIAYMIPFGVLLVIQGRKDWELALSLGLLASLGNDLGYFVVGDAFFGFQVNLLDWYAHQFGFYGNTTLFIFNGGLFSFAVPSWLMGASIYARVAVVMVSLRRWWYRQW
ncbi:MAG TPA: hypothetical protein VED22_06485 [Nitrososphaerales archaeon]|nr:hypothetical protein [Nitrososphaerales archaeon]